MPLGKRFLTFALLLSLMNVQMAVVLLSLLQVAVVLLSLLHMAAVLLQMDGHDGAGEVQTDLVAPHPRLWLPLVLAAVDVRAETLQVGENARKLLRLYTSGSSVH